MAMLVKFALAAGMAFPLVAQTVSGSMAVHAQAAQRDEQQNDFTAAAHEYEILAAQFPKNAEIQSNLGVARYFNHQLHLAIANFRKAIALNPHLMVPHLFTGLAWYQLSNPDAAVPELEWAVRLKPSDVMARIWLGYAYSAQSQDGAAIREFEAASHLNPRNVDVWYSLGYTWLQIGQVATAKLLEAVPDGGRVWELAGEQCLLRGDRKMALHDFKQANARRPDIAELRAMIRNMGGSPTDGPEKENSAGRDRIEDELYWQAREAEQNSRTAFERVIELAPASYRAHEIMADADVAEAQYGKAIGEYQTVLKLKPNIPGIHNALGEAFFQAGEVPEALKEFDAELGIQPYSAIAYMNAGRALLILGQDKAAAKMLNDALKMDRPPLETYVLLGKIDVMHRDYRDAVSVLRRYMASEKTNSNAYYLLAMAYRGLDEKVQMNSALSQFKKISQDKRPRSTAQQELLPSTDWAQVADMR